MAPAAPPSCGILGDAPRHAPIRTRPDPARGPRASAAMQGGHRTGAHQDRPDPWQLNSRGERSTADGRGRGVKLLRATPVVAARHYSFAQTTEHSSERPFVDQAPWETMPCPCPLSAATDGPSEGRATVGTTVCGRRGAIWLGQFDEAPDDRESGKV